MMNFKTLYPHLVVLVIFISISFIYFSPLLEGKRLDMPDIKHHKGMSKEVIDYRNDTGEEALWTNSMFSGMPAYQISIKSNNNLVQYLVKVIHLGMPRPANLLFLYLFGFYLLLLSLSIDYRVAAIGSIAFAFSSYFFIIIMAGHMTKAHAIGYVPMVVAGVLYTYRTNKIILGGVLTSLAVAMQLYANHLQITYYLVLILLLIGIVQFFKELKSKNLYEFTKRSVILLVAALLASGTTLTRLSTTMEYGKESTRSKSELTSNIDNKTSGLDKDYATAWSYGVAETFTLLIPNFYGGASQGELSTDSETYNAIRRTPNAKQIIKQLPLYWGDQPFTSGPTYVGAIVVFLFVFGLLFVKSEMRVWILLATILSIMLAWGKNFMFLTDLFLEYFPAYNKFRAVSMILVIAEFTIPLLGFLALHKFLFDNVKSYNSSSFISMSLSKESALKYAYYFVGGIALVFALIPSLFFDFVGIQDINLEKNGWPVEALQSDRASLLSNDAWRSFIFISLAFITMWLFIRNRLKNTSVVILIGFFILLDMWTINKRYLNDSNFVRKRKVEVPYKMTAANKQILKDKDPNFRVFNQSVSTFNDASTSYFHKSIGGYHGAKLKRYQELIENHISKGNIKVLNMLNAKYIIDNRGVVQENINALGNAWFVNNFQLVSNADEEILALNTFDPRNDLIVDNRFKEYFLENLDNTSNNIYLTEYKPNYLKYKSEANQNSIAVFSEIFYDKGWNAYINGEQKPHFRANYVLRAMQVPKGNNIIEFKFEPTSFYISEKISLASSIILILLICFVSFKEFKD